MKFGLVYAYESYLSQFQDFAAEARLAEEVSFDSMLVGEHHFDFGVGYIPAPMIVCGALCAATRRVSIGTGIIPLPLYNPITIAEQSATVDAMSGGRFILGLGIGQRDEEFGAFGVIKRERVGRFVESLELITRLLGEEEVTFSGRFYSTNKITVRPRLGKGRRIPIWVAARAPKAVERVAKLGLCLYSDPVSSMEALAASKRIYDAAYASRYQSLSGVEKPLRRDFCVAKTNEEAWRIANKGFLPQYKDYFAWGHMLDDTGKPIGNDGSAAEQVMETMSNRVIVGSPETAITMIERYAKELGTNHLVFRLPVRGMRQEEIRAMLTLAGKEVLPYFKDNR